jgi:hypothetical protein
MVQEKIIKPRSGWGMLIVWLLIIPAFATLAVVVETNTGLGEEIIPPLFPFVAIAFILIPFGFQAIQPNQARVYTLFGEYKGSALESGFFWVNPFYGKRKLSLRVRNFETSAGKPVKVNDRDGNPIEISAVVVWRAVNTAEILFGSIITGRVGAAACRSVFAPGERISCRPAFDRKRISFSGHAPARGYRG